MTSSDGQDLTSRPEPATRRLERPFVSRGVAGDTQLPEGRAGGESGPPRPFRASGNREAAEPVPPRTSEGARLGWAILEEGVAGHVEEPPRVDPDIPDLGSTVESGLALPDSGLPAAHGATSSGRPEAENRRDGESADVRTGPDGQQRTREIAGERANHPGAGGPSWQRTASREEAAIADSLEEIARAVRGGGVNELLVANPGDTLTALIVGYVTASLGARDREPR